MSRGWDIPALDPKASLATNAKRILAVRVAELFSYGPVIDDVEAIAQLHDARIAAKRLRYTLETFDSVFGADGAQAIAEIKELQDLIGQVHDLDVRIELIDEERKAIAEAVTDGSKKTGRIKASQELDGSLSLLLVRERANRAKLHEQVVTAWQAMTKNGLRHRLEHLTEPSVAG
jgi:CHAD domain-containing protein